MGKKEKKFTSSDLNVSDNFVCIWTNAMDDILIDTYCHENALENRAKHEAANLKTKSFENYDKLVMLYGNDRATGKHVESGSDMLKRNAHKNLKRSSADSSTIDDIDEIIYMDTASLKNIEGHEQGEKSQPTNDAPTSNVYP
ncbi:hypothetical protein HAX54_021273 [Datura stramonium]|uniref:Uncharacterized protein n=1 Tax=Datura stramonium TaxID=4076 RepID=A0ABS8S405_DATST|nr:hypothetical protein [Datura stramonium]